MEQQNRLVPVSPRHIFAAPISMATLLQELPLPSGNAYRWQHSLSSFINKLKIPLRYQEHWQDLFCVGAVAQPQLTLASTVVDFAPRTPTYPLSTTLAYNAGTIAQPYLRLTTTKVVDFAPRTPTYLPTTTLATNAGAIAQSQLRHDRSRRFCSYRAHTYPPSTTLATIQRRGNRAAAHRITKKSRAIPTYPASIPLASKCRGNSKAINFSQNLHSTQQGWGRQGPVQTIKHC